MKKDFDFTMKIFEKEFRVEVWQFSSKIRIEKDDKICWIGRYSRDEIWHDECVEEFEHYNPGVIDLVKEEVKRREKLQAFE